MPSSDRTPDAAHQRESKAQGRGRYVEPTACIFPWALALLATAERNWMVAAAFLWAGVVFIAAAKLDDHLRRHGR